MDQSEIYLVGKPSSAYKKVPTNACVLKNVFFARGEGKKIADAASLVAKQLTEMYSQQGKTAYSPVYMRRKVMDLINLHANVRSSRADRGDQQLKKETNFKQMLTKVFPGEKLDGTSAPKKKVAPKRTGAKTTKAKAAEKDENESMGESASDEDGTDDTA